MPDDAQSVVAQFRNPGRTLDDADRERLSHVDFHAAVCLAIHTANEPLNHALAVQLLREEMYRRRADGCHDGGRVLLSGLLLAQFRNVADVPLLWEVKQLDMDMGCYFDVQLLVFGGVEATLTFLRQRMDVAARQAAEYLEECRAGGDFDDLDGYHLFRLNYFDLPRAGAA
jgi:hypothetical protein